MTRHSERLRGLVLLYIVLLGCIPFLDGLTCPHSPEGFHPRHNVQLGRKLMHIAPALVGVGVAASLIQQWPVRAFVGIALLAMQIVLGLADYRRIGFNSAVPREFAASEYLLIAFLLALPFAVACFYSLRRDRREQRR